MTINYDARYDSELLRGIDDPTTPRPWNLEQTILAYAQPHHHLLDIGCGTAFKLVPLTPYFAKIWALDPSDSMLAAARQTIHAQELKNLELVAGRGEALPFPDASFEMVTCMLSRWNIAEIYRVLKPGGHLFIEHVGCEDKKAFKKYFGQDTLGWRGQFINEQPEDNLVHLQKEFSNYFSTVTIKNGFWYTFYNREGIIELLRFTPTIRNFDLENDGLSLEQAIKEFSTSNGIRLQQNRILIYAQKDF